MDFVSVPLAGELTHGAPLSPTAEEVSLPAQVIEPEREALYRVVKGVDGAKRGDLLIVELRASAKTGELVLAILHEKAYVGRLWLKHGLRELRRESGPPITGKFQIVGTVNLIVRS